MSVYTSESTTHASTETFSFMAASRARVTIGAMLRVTTTAPVEE